VTSVRGVRLTRHSSLRLSWWLCKPALSEGCIKSRGMSKLISSCVNAIFFKQINGLIIFAFVKKNMTSYISHFLEWFKLCMLVLWWSGRKGKTFASDLYKNILVYSSDNAQVMVFKYLAVVIQQRLINILTKIAIEFEPECLQTPIT